MALTKKDLQQIQNLFVEQLTHERRYLHVALDQQAQDIKRDIRDEMDAKFVAFENKMNGRFIAMEGLFRHELQAVINVLLTFVPERFEKLEHDVVRIKTHIGLA